MRDWGAAGGFTLEGAGADGGGDHHFARVHRGEGPRQWTSRETAEGRAHRVRENHGDGDRKYFNGGGAGGWRDGAGECSAGAGSDGFSGDAEEDGSGDLRGRDFGAADSRCGETARDGTHGDSGPDRGGDVSAGGGHYGRGVDDYGLRAGASRSGDCEIGAGGSAG